MFFNPRNPIILFILSFVGMMVGMSFKIMHWPGGNIVPGSMIMVQIMSILWLIIIIARNPGSDN